MLRLLSFQLLGAACEIQFALLVCYDIVPAGGAWADALALILSRTDMALLRPVGAIGAPTQPIPINAIKNAIRARDKSWLVSPARLAPITCGPQAI